MDDKSRELQTIRLNAGQLRTQLINKAINSNNFKTARRLIRENHKILLREIEKLLREIEKRRAALREERAELLADQEERLRVRTEPGEKGFCEIESLGSV